MLRESLRTDICPAIQRAHNHGVLSKSHTVPCGAGHGAGFLFIPDLTDKASGIVLVVLILLYVGSQLGSTLVMSSAATMDPMQRRMMLFLPLVFVLFVFRFPAGVLVYWITTNFWTMAQQYLVRKRVGPRMALASGGDVAGTATASGGKPKGTGPRSGPSATKALPKASADTDSANGAKATTGGLASLFRGRAQTADQPDAVTNGSSHGSSSGSDSDSDSGSRSQSGSRSGSRSGSGSGSRSGSRSRSASSKSSSGSGKTSGSAKGSSSGGGSSKPEDGAKPPPPPRKRKKRSGRRR
jgi:hypothetical protein